MLSSETVFLDSVNYWPMVSEYTCRNRPVVICTHVDDFFKYNSAFMSTPMFLCLVTPFRKGVFDDPSCEVAARFRFSNGFVLFFFLMS